MKKDFSEKKLWGIERTSNRPERLVYIYEALKKIDLPKNFKLVDIACGYGVIVDGLGALFPDATISGVDIVKYKQWDMISDFFGVKMIQMPLQDFIKLDNKYDVVMMLNSYRNWTVQKNMNKRSVAKYNFDKWLLSHAKYFITSKGNLTYKKIIIGSDFRGYEIELYTL